MTQPSATQGVKEEALLAYVRTGKEASLPPDNSGGGYSVPDTFEDMIQEAINRRAETLQVPYGVSEVYANPAASQAMLDDPDFDVLAWLASAIADDMRFASTGPTRILRDPYTHKPFVHFFVTRPALQMPDTRTATPSASVERVAQALQDHMEQQHGVCLKASEWDAAAIAALAACVSTQVTRQAHD